MDYEKAYKDALKRAEAMIQIAANKNEAVDFKNTIFPELKESEDERIRKAIVSFIDEMKGDFDSYEDIKLDEMVAWIEKQGEQQKTKIDLIMWKPVSEYKGGRVLATNDVDILVGYINSDGDCESEDCEGTLLCGITGFVEIEDVLPPKQGEQKPDINIQINPSEYINDMGGNGCYLKNTTQNHTDKIEPKFKIGDIITNKKSKDTVKIVQILHDSYCYSGWDGAATVHSDFSISEQDDWELIPQKHADKVEPRFKVGDWITNGIDFTFQIHSIEDNMYLRSDDYFIDIETADKNFRLWTIEDAKDGDVLVDVYGDIGIFEKRYGINWHTHCYLDCRGRFIPEGGSHGSICYPATKEQRDILFSKMGEAGYTWDAEQKQLKKIEQKLIDSYCKDNCKGYQETGKCFADGKCKAKRDAEQKSTQEVESFVEEQQRFIDKAAEWFRSRFPNMSNEAIEKFKEDMKGE
jgi:hypothetical protein